MKYSTPEKIIIIDSASPVKPDIKDKKNISFYSLGKNFGAGIDGTQNLRLSGWDRGILGSAALAFLEGHDYYVYIEQDCLIKGKGIIEYAISKMGGKPIMLGGGKGTPQPLQQSFIIIKNEFIPEFLYKETKLTKEELKKDCEARYLSHFKDKLCYLPYGHGRARPINFNDQYFYAQHLRTEELERFKKFLDA
jgi:hypothetical protein